MKDGPFTDTYVEIKGTFSRKNGHISKEKWEWFHDEHSNSVLWIREDLLDLGIISSLRPEKSIDASPSHEVKL